jgi:decaprenylphosphoryl-5-phosphoribose phosphatase
MRRRTQRREPAGALARLDLALLRFARTAGHSPEAERGVAGFSKLGEHGALWLAIGAAGSALDSERREQWGRATALVFGAHVLNTVVKLVVRRRRPELPGLPPLAGTPTKLSFPSAHATTSFAAAGVYSRLGVPAAPLYATATGLALSRLYLGLHYPSDTLVGMALGTAVSRLMP